MGGGIVVLFAVNSINYMHLQALFCSSSRCHNAVATAKGTDGGSVKEMRTNSHPPNQPPTLAVNWRDVAIYTVI